MASAPALVWIAEAGKILERIAATQAEAIETASQWCADAIGSDGLVHLFGTGHSRMAVEEMFPRYGSYPGFNPIVELSMTRSASSRRRDPAAGSGGADIDWATDVTAMTRSPRALAPRAISTGTAVVPLAEKIIITSWGPNRKFDRIVSARPGIRSMNIA